jgi:ubiquinone/menaquinone biosynthesis C-methylase UbiE
VSANPPGQYATDANLAARQRLWWSGRREPRFDLFSWVLDLADVIPGSDQRVLDVGCGNGAYEVAMDQRGHRGLRVALDLSAGMLLHVHHALGVQADVQRLPFPADAFDLVLAPHMLYHVPDIEAAARECRRVLRPGGLVVAVTNSDSNLVELRRLVEAAVGSGWRMVQPSVRHFSLENGEGPLSVAFESVTRVDCPETRLEVTDLDAVVDYVVSVGDHYEAEVGRPWADVVERVRQQAGDLLASGRPLRFTSAAGAFVCR